jgi:hypothetical protein
MGATHVAIQGKISQAGFIQESFAGRKVDFEHKKTGFRDAGI